jgi:hypothetical protein
MFPRNLARFFAAPFMILALAFAFTAPAMAGGGEGPTGPTVSVSPPTITVDSAGQVRVTVTLHCWDAAASDGHVIFNVSFQQRQAGGGTSVEAFCQPAPQEVTLVVASQTGTVFRPGPMNGYLGFEVYASNGVGYGSAPINQVVLPS